MDIALQRMQRLRRHSPLHKGRKLTLALFLSSPSQNELAKLVIDRVPSVEMVRFVNSGTEACLSVVRLMRAYTNRTKILKFVGCYHGHADQFLVQAGSGVITLGLADSPGVPQVCLRVCVDGAGRRSRAVGAEWSGGLEEEHAVAVMGGATAQCDRSECGVKSRSRGWRCWLQQL